MNDDDIMIAGNVWVDFVDNLLLLHSTFKTFKYCMATHRHRHPSMLQPRGHHLVSPCAFLSPIYFCGLDKAEESGECIRQYEYATIDC